jgi:hypothetical protein
MISDQKFDLGAVLAHQGEHHRQLPRTVLRYGGFERDLQRDDDGARAEPRCVFRQV